MSLTTLIRHWPLGHTLESLSESKLGVGALVLVTSLVSFCRSTFMLTDKIGNDDKVSHLIFRHFVPKSIPSLATLLVVIPVLLSGSISYITARSPYAALLLSFVAYWSGLVFFSLAYRLSSFHPLAKYPGPLLAKASKWWAAYLSGTGNQHRFLKGLHDRYGDVVRIGWNLHSPFKISAYPLPGPNELSIRDPSFIQPVLGQGGLRKGPRVYMPCFILADLITCDDQAGKGNLGPLL